MSPLKAFWGVGLLSLFSAGAFANDNAVNSTSHSTNGIIVTLEVPQRSAATPAPLETHLGISVPLSILVSNASTRDIYVPHLINYPYVRLRVADGTGSPVSATPIGAARFERSLGGSMQSELIKPGGIKRWIVDLGEAYNLQEGEFTARVEFVRNPTGFSGELSPVPFRVSAKQ